MPIKRMKTEDVFRMATEYCTVGLYTAYYFLKIASETVGVIPQSSFQRMLHLSHDLIKLHAACESVNGVVLLSFL